MDFFGRQVRTRKLSRRLVGLFLLAVLAVVVAVNVVVMVVASLLQQGTVGPAPLEYWLDSHSGLLLWTSAIVVGVIGMASLYKTAVLSQGGAAVARALGGELVTPDSTDPLRRRLLNVVEEMAIASGVPMPAVYVLEQETGINAFAAGHNPANAAVAVTRGALVQLNRAELQGVIAHEFSHVLNGDMRLNIRMMGLLFGLLAIAVIARLVLRHGSRAGGRRGGGVAVILLAALAIMILGYVGLFFGRLLQAAISRTRESLADASAVQFTRDPAGLRGALVKIGATAGGSRLNDADAEEVAHMLFAPGVRRLFETHPPLVERIRSLDPAFDEKEFAVAAANLRSAEALPAEGLEVEPAANRLEQLLGATVAVAPASVAQLVGNPGTAHVALAETLRLSLPDGIRAATESPRKAAGLLLAFAIDTGARQATQLRIVEMQLGEGAARAVAQWLPDLTGLHPMQRLPAFLRLFPAVQTLSREEKEKLKSCFESLVQDDSRQSLHAYALGRLAEMQLRDELDPGARPRRQTLEAVGGELQVLFSVLANHGQPDATAARHAYEIGMHHLLPRNRPAFGVPAHWPQRLDGALARLDELQPPAKEQLVEALVKTVAHDLRLTVDEAELLRVVCAILHCPLPPLLTEA